MSVQLTDAQLRAQPRIDRSLNRKLWRRRRRIGIVKPQFALLHSLKHYKVLHEQNLFLTVEFQDVPFVPLEGRIDCEPLGHDCWRVKVRYGFMDRPDVPLAVQLCEPFGVCADPMGVSYFLSREKVVAGAGGGGMASWRDRLLSVMARNAGSVTDFFEIPTNRVVELGTRVEI